MSLLLSQILNYLRKHINCWYSSFFLSARQCTYLQYFIFQLIMFINRRCKISSKTGDLCITTFCTSKFEMNWMDPCGAVIGLLRSLKDFFWLYLTTTWLNSQQWTDRFLSQAAIFSLTVQRLHQVQQYNLETIFDSTCCYACCCSLWPLGIRKDY